MVLCWRAVGGLGTPYLSRVRGTHPRYTAAVHSPLGEFLILRRSRLQPADVGLTGNGRRRVPGLRREEVAQLADVSVDYYMRLEQGRETSPSPQVAAAIGTALQLDEHALAHLYRLAGLTPPRTIPTAAAVDPQLAAFLDEWPEHPAMVLGQAFDVLAANPLAEALFLGFGPTRNLLESVFLDPAAAVLYRDWDTVAASMVASFRLLDAAQPRESRIAKVRGNLLAADPRFAALWTGAEVRGSRLTSKRFRHPLAGDLDLHLQAFDVRSAPGQELVVYRAEPGSPSSAALRALQAPRRP